MKYFWNIFCQHNGWQAGRSRKWLNGALSLTYHPTKGHHTVWSSQIIMMIGFMISGIEMMMMWEVRMTTPGMFTASCFLTRGFTWKLPSSVGPCGRRASEGKTGQQSEPGGLSGSLCAPRDTCTSPVYVHSEMLQWVRGSWALGREKKEVSSLQLELSLLGRETPSTDLPNHNTHLERSLENLMWHCFGIFLFSFAFLAVEHKRYILLPACVCECVHVFHPPRGPLYCVNFW